MGSGYTREAPRRGYVYLQQYVLKDAVDSGRGCKNRCTALTFRIEFQGMGTEAPSIRIGSSFGRDSMSGLARSVIEDPA